MTLCLNRPQRKNALSSDMIDVITAAIERASIDDETRVVVIRTAGENFCTGADLSQSNEPRGDGLAEPPRTGHLQRRLHVSAHRLVETLASAQVPIVSSVRGWAAGLGLALAVSADVVVADTTARFWVPFVARGFTPDSATTWLLPRLVGVARAKEMILRGKPLDAKRAEEWGLISSCVEPELLDQCVAEVADEFTCAATVSVGLARTLLHQNLEVGLSQALKNEAIHEELAIRSRDFKEGMRSFAEKRNPNYTGR
jgi:2-(1,2-epoxy-1,2-dihydrophenyl)acetyl-CoA isomerase